jgi:hypothetical protein
MWSICTELDDFLEDKTIWIAKLSNNLLVYQDDDRPGKIPNAWMRLKEYIKKNNLLVVALALRFRSHVIDMPPNAPAYYYAKSVIMNGNKSQNCAAIGYLKDDVIEICDFTIPELESINNFKLTYDKYAYINPALLINLAGGGAV